MVLLGAVVILDLSFGRLGDGSFECPGNARQLSSSPLPENNPPADGFYAAPVCNSEARDRMQAVPWVLAGTLAAASASVVLPVGLARHGGRRRPTLAAP
jgi:hypothetical protein